MRLWWKTGSVLLLAALVVSVDQYTKAWIRQALPYGAVWPAPWAEALPWVRIIHWANRGAAFGLFQQAGPVFAALAVLVVALMLWHLPQVGGEPWLMRLGLGLILGGAVGNLIDRLTHGVVTDFIAVGHFPVFNLADAAITVGALAVLLGGWEAKEGAVASPDVRPGEEGEGVPHE